MKNFSVQLKNPPVNGDVWQLYVTNRSRTDWRFIQQIPMNGIANFTDIPDTWDFPLYINLAVYRWIQWEGQTALEQIYYIQNNFEPGSYGYNALLYKSINVPGEWFFNFTTVVFEYDFRGTITELQLIHDSYSDNIPVGKISPGQGKIFANIRNDIIYPEVIGVHWVVKDPSGIIIEDVNILSPTVIQPGQSYPLMSSEWLPLTKLGKYTISIDMFMTIDRIIITSYSGELCTVGELPDVTFDEFTVTPPEKTLQIGVGQTIRIPFGFRYKAPETTSVNIWASLFKYSIGIIDRQGQAQTKGVIALDESLVLKAYYGEISITIGELPLGIYGLIVELPDYKVEVKIDNFAELSGAPSMMESITPLLGMAMMMMMFSTMTPMMEEDTS